MLNKWTSFKKIQCHYAESYPSALPSVSLVVFVFSVIIALKCISRLTQNERTLEDSCFTVIYP